ncbi:MAG: extracellular solute-binding protein [Roseibium album]|uniref:ABC transporter substrate-binding protein n=1 Tax=Roseibium album TaxID=311410 RepID=UPI0018CA8246|nr:spermidine/putrescine-binding protein [Labrenzia sp. EL_132]MBG6230928.1 spermidine/putrescine-binding protein [Labrenzia sp. EL_208]
MTKKNQSEVFVVRSFVSRRDIIKGMAAGSAGLALMGTPTHAQSKTNINMVCWQGYDDAFKAGSFLEDNNLEINPTYIGSNDEILTKITAGGRGSIDIVTPYMGYVPLMVAADMLEPIDEASVPNLASVLPVFRNDPNILVDGKLYAAPFTWGAAPMLYDPAFFGDAVPKSWRDLEKPELEGKFGFSDDPIGNITIAAIVATDAAVATELTEAQLKQAIDYLILLKGKARLVATSWGELADAMARGEIVATFSGWETMKKFAGDKGKVVEFIYPEEGTFAWLDNVCIVKDAPNLDADLKMANHVLSTESQLLVGEEMLQGIVSQTAIDALNPEAAGLYPYADMDAFGASATFFPFPPLEDRDGLMSIARWNEEYERFKSA